MTDVLVLNTRVNIHHYVYNKRKYSINYFFITKINYIECYILSRKHEITTC